VADLDPLDATRAPHKDLDPATYGLTIWDLDRAFITNGLAGTDRLTLREILEILRDTYCATTGVEYMFIADRERKAWLQVRMESCRNRMSLDTTARRRILEKLVEAESFEKFLHTNTSATSVSRSKGAKPRSRSSTACSPTPRARACGRR
jgi:2-oxoglutarate dehydrogenase E1 component